MVKKSGDEVLSRISSQLENVQNQLDELVKKVERGKEGQKEYLTMKEFAKLAGIPLSTGYQISSKNLLPKYRFGKRVLFKRVDVIAYIEKFRIASESEIHSRAINSLTNGGHHDA
ncbi:MAG: helix-turn-helix domain-containing protein [Candidatus Cloacimonetes bacterium]|jgi:excisionase family DNA binding protein|nr:helix-turn-helix domain-containing protein [Candidatus Cloacimonadota bacterium]